jgi:hypothetical protein
MNTKNKKSGEIISRIKNLLRIKTEPAAQKENTRTPPDCQTLKSDGIKDMPPKPAHQPLDWKELNYINGAIKMLISIKYRQLIHIYSSSFPPELQNWETLLYMLVESWCLNAKLARKIEEKMGTELGFRHGGFNKLDHITECEKNERERKEYLETHKKAAHALKDMLEIKTKKREEYLRNHEKDTPPANQPQWTPDNKYTRSMKA